MQIFEEAELYQCYLCYSAEDTLVEARAHKNTTSIYMFINICPLPVYNSVTNCGRFFSHICGFKTEGGE